MRLRVYLSTLLLLICFSAKSQFSSVKTNLLGLATTNINIAIDIKVTSTTTINIPISVNPFDFGRYKINYVATQPGVRYWFYENYIGHFISGYLIGAKFNTGVNNIYRNGWAAGAGFSYGYSWMLSTRWNFECEAGVGAVYSQYEQGKDGVGVFERETIAYHRRWLIMPTKMCLSLSYIF